MCSAKGGFWAVLLWDRVCFVNSGLEFGLTFRRNYILPLVGEFEAFLKYLRKRNPFLGNWSHALDTCTCDFWIRSEMMVTMENHIFWSETRVRVSTSRPHTLTNNFREYVPPPPGVIHLSGTTTSSNIVYFCSLILTYSEDLFLKLRIKISPKGFFVTLYWYKFDCLSFHFYWFGAVPLHIILIADTGFGNLVQALGTRLWFWLLYRV